MNERKKEEEEKKMEEKDMLCQLNGPGKHLNNEHQSKVSDLFKLLAFSNIMCITHEKRKGIEIILKSINLSVYWFCS